jgi:3-hydroxy-9,10-secoandrosta-1,3,5(10)-triene-9,17-dione monooxygenase reductase component
MSDYVHYTDPFAIPPEARSAARRLRGRLSSGVTIWTAGDAESRAGLTISSMVVAEGAPSVALGLMNDTTALWDAIQEKARFVIHILAEDDREIADRFAGLRPSPGGVFAGLEVEDGAWGPAIGSFSERAYCRFVDATEAGYQQLVRGEIERMELGELAQPLVYFRGRYRALERDEE